MTSSVNTLSRKSLLTGVNTKTFTKVATSELNNTTKSVQVTANNSGSRSFQIGDVVTAFDQATYASPTLDPNARLGLVTARSNTKVTVTWGLLGTPITAIAGRATLGLVQRGNTGDLNLDVDETAGDNSELVQAATKTLAITNQGLPQRISYDGNVSTLPAVAPGLVYAFVNDGDAVGAVGFSISPAAADHIDGGGLGVGTVNKDLINTKATARPGDTVVLIGGAANTWNVARMSGTFAKEA